MKDLCDRTGLSRQAIHFYIQKGLLPRGRQRTRTSAVYGQEHLDRLRLILRLQKEQFLPLKVIRALLRQRDDLFTPPQRRFLASMRTSAAARLPRRRQRTVSVDMLLRKAGVSREDLEEMLELGLVTAVPDKKGRLRMTDQETWLVEAVGELRALGLTRELGFLPAELATLLEAVDQLLQREVAMLSERLARVEPEQAAELVLRVLPVIDSIITRYHDTRVVQLLTEL